MPYVSIYGMMGITKRVNSEEHGRQTGHTGLKV